MVSLPKFKKALGNRATKTAKNIRRKSRRKPRKNRTLINTRKRVGRGYGSWRYNMATLPNKQLEEVAQFVKNGSWRKYMATLSNKQLEEVAQFVKNVSFLEKWYKDMSPDEREESKRIERDSINNSDEEYNQYNGTLERSLEIWENMTPLQKKTAKELYRQNNNVYGGIEVMYDGPYTRFFGRY